MITFPNVPGGDSKLPLAYCNIPKLLEWRIKSPDVRWMLENDISQITCRENLVKTCFGTFLDNYPDQYPQHTMPVPFFGCVKVNVFEILKF